MTGTFSQIQRRGIEADALDVAIQVAALAGPVLREIAPLLAQAEQETATALRTWIAAQPGNGARYTAYQHSRVLLQLRQALDTLTRLSPALAVAMGKGSSRAGVLSAQHLTSIVHRNSVRFATHLEAPIRLDLARIAATGQGLIPHFKSSASRYSEGIQAQIRQELAVGLLRHENFGQLIERLSSRSTIAQAAGAAPTPMTAASGLLRGADYRVERLVRTEMAYAYDVQALEAFTQAKVQLPDLQRKWVAALDLRTCPRCGALDGELSDHAGDFVSGNPPLHPNCVPPGTMIDTPSGHKPIESLKAGDVVVGGLTGLPRRVLQVHRNPFDGSLVSLASAQRTVLLTPNHPALTSRGWVNAEDLELGDKLYRHLTNAGIREPDINTGPPQHGPPGLDEENIPLAIDGGFLRGLMPGAWVDLDIDLALRERNVAVIDTNGILMDRIQTDVLQDVDKHGLKSRRLFDGGDAMGPGGTVFKSALHSTNGTMSALGELLSAFSALSSHSDDVCRRCGSSLDASAIHVVGDRLAAHSETLRHFQNGEIVDVVHSPKRLRFDSELVPRSNAFRAHQSNVMPVLLGAIGIDQISQQSHKGEVWNLSVESDESYIANGVVVHNCRCCAVPWRQAWDEMMAEAA